MSRPLVVALLAALTACTSPSSEPAPRTAVTTTVTAEQTTRPPLPTPPPDACARAALARLDVVGRAGQVLMIGLDVTDPLARAAELAPYRIGNVFLAGRSSAGADVLRRAVDTLQLQTLGATGTFAHVAVDQEGGFVQTLTGPGFSAIPTALEQAADPDLATRTTQWAAEVAGTGITLDLAPVADVVPPGTAAENPPIGASSRQYGGDPAAVAATITTVVTAMRDGGLGTTVKHFPGLGRVRVNTDTATGAADERTTAEDPALAPFRAGIEAGTDAVMVSSATYPQLDPAAVAAFSRPIVTGLLKEQLGYEGIVMSDDLGNAVAVSDRPIGQRATDFLAAGGDLALSVDVDDAAPMSQAVVRRAQTDPAFAERLADAALRVLRSKQDSGLLVC